MIARNKIDCDVPKYFSKNDGEILVKRTIQTDRITDWNTTEEAVGNINNETQGREEPSNAIGQNPMTSSFPLNLPSPNVLYCDKYVR